MADTDPTPLAYGLLDITKLKLVLTNVYASEDTAQAGAIRLTNQWRTVIAIPLFGPEALTAMQAQLRASRTAEDSLRRETIQLRNEAAVRRGHEVADAHAAGLPAPGEHHG